ncbi:MAG TPA: hypothetical protein PL112_04900 [Candidatus Obscuribacter sp.]|nr:hypothetical protein [Candidatus Obscuribacter sp.]
MAFNRELENPATSADSRQVENKLQIDIVDLYFQSQLKPPELIKNDPAYDSAGPALMDGRENLLLNASLRIDNKQELLQFKKDMTDFEKQAKEHHIPESEVAKTYQAVDKLLTSSEGVLNQDSRRLLAENFMHLAAYPSKSDQGIYSTCNATSLQEMLLSRKPGLIAADLADAAINGSFVAPDGQKIDLDAESMQPNYSFPGEAASLPQDNVRAYGTQVLNHMLVNEMTQRVTPEHNTMLYQQRHQRTETDSGERLISPRDGSEMTNISGAAIRGPGLGEGDLATAVKRYFPEDSQFLVRSGGKDREGVVQIDTPEELSAIVQKAKQESKLPLMVEVNGADPLFGGGFEPGKHASHVLSIKDADKGGKQLSISNQWGEAGDIQVSSNQFFQTMIYEKD